MKETSSHIYFWGTYLSNWHSCSFKDSQGTQYNTTEKYMMYQKALLFKDYETADLIMKARDPKEQKSLGRKVKNFNEAIWNTKKYEVVVQGNLYKFLQNEDLKAALLKTGDKILVEGSPVDFIWGVGLKWDNPLILDEKNWRGENLLGKALMDVRKILRNGR